MPRKPKVIPVLDASLNIDSFYTSLKGLLFLQKHAALSGSYSAVLQQDPSLPGDVQPPVLPKNWPHATGIPGSALFCQPLAKHGFTQKILASGDTVAMRRKKKKKKKMDKIS